MNKTHNLVYDRDISGNKSVSALIGVIFFVIATTLGAYVRIPVEGSPVPITMQTFFVMLAGAVLGCRLGSFSQFAYLAIGAAGLPIFQGYSFGTAYLLGPTGGYLAGFVFAAYFTGKTLGSPGQGLKKIIAYFVIGDLIIHTCGTAWLIYLYKMDIVKAVSAGILPFIPGETAKILFASVIYSKISGRSKVIFP